MPQTTAGSVAERDLSQGTPIGWMHRAVRAFAIGFAALPLLLYLLWLAPGHRVLDSLLGLAYTTAFIAFPLVARFRGWMCALYYLLLGVVSVAALVNLVLTAELPSLGAAVAAFRSSKDEASSLLGAAGPAAGAVLAAAAVCLVGCVSFCWRAPVVPFSAGMARMLLALPLLLVFTKDPGGVYPTSLYKILDGLTQYGASMERGNRLLSDPFEVNRSKGGDEIVVLYVGESSSASHWQLNGYARETTPLLAERAMAGEIVSLPAHMSTSGMTEFAVPGILTAFDEIGGRDGKPDRRSVVTVMGRAGFRTAYYARNDPVAAATEADEMVQRSDDSVVEMDTSRDIWLVEMTKRWLARVSSGPTFVVLHGWGSHIAFETQYPASFARWTGDYEEKSYPANQTVNNYDNSILYTDHVLDAAMKRLEQDGRPALLVYTSDHGEPWMRHKLWRYAAPRDTHLLHVPFFFWANSTWRHANPEKWAALQRFADSGKATSHLNVVPTLTGMLSIRYEGAPLHRDILAPQFEEWGTTPALDVDEKTVVQAIPPASAALLARSSPRARTQ